MKHLSIIVVVLSLAVVSCEKSSDNACNDIRCDADCRIAGHTFGRCEGNTCVCGDPEVCGDGADNDLDGATDCWDTDCGYEGYSETTCNDGLDNDCDGDTDCYDIGDCGSDPACGGCDNDTCNADCISSGWTGGECVSGACQCTDDCTRHDQCGATEVCYGGECTSPWGRTWRFTVVDGHLPERQWWDDACYDSPCGPPDVYVAMVVGGSTCTTSEQSDTYNPTWNEYCDYTVTSSTSFEWTMWDVDLVADDTITYIEPFTITVEDIRGGGWIWQVDYSGTTYDILAIAVSEP